MLIHFLILILDLLKFCKVIFTPLLGASSNRPNDIVQYPFLWIIVLQRPGVCVLFSVRKRVVVIGLPLVCMLYTGPAYGVTFPC
jgi:hypothetical protein